MLVILVNISLNSLGGQKHIYIYLSLYYYIINIVNTKMEFSGTCDVTMWLCCIVGNVGAKFWKAVHWSSIAHL